MSDGMTDTAQTVEENNGRKELWRALAAFYLSRDDDKSELAGKIEEAVGKAARFHRYSLLAEVVKNLRRSLDEGDRLEWAYFIVKIGREGILTEDEVEGLKLISPFRRKIVLLEVIPYEDNAEILRTIRGKLAVRKQKYDRSKTYYLIFDSVAMEILGPS